MNKHGHVTWRELLAKLKELPEEHLDDTATVHGTVLDEFTPVIAVLQAGTPAGCHADGILDPDHLFLEYEG